ncbi:DUF3592 domain-containing protein [Chitinibacter sp. S2-10]|uniref:DUF3592 domain-containing protein n=1 Tax=Chitinibacter sp. S2-10 TaxID=3373597 RepID=UPI00397788CA
MNFQFEWIRLDLMSPNTWLMVIGAVFILIGLIFIPIALRKVREDQAAMLWPQTSAELQAVEVAKHVREQPRKEHAGLSVSYACVLDYHYMVKGISYSAKHGLPANNANHATELAAQQSLGSKRMIYYNPAHPEQYRVELASRYAGLFWLLPFAAFAGFGALVIWLGAS